LDGLELVEGCHINEYMNKHSYIIA
jgi:hypothetical protein